MLTRQKTTFYQLDKRLERLEALAQQRKAQQAQARKIAQIADKLRSDPKEIMLYAGMTPDPWQSDFLESQAKRRILNCSRQSGKSTVTASLAAHRVMTTPYALILLVAASLRQSQELFRKVQTVYRGIGLKPTAESALRAEFSNHSRIVALPATENIRGFSAVNLLVMDEAAWIPDQIYDTVRPMLAVSDGDMVLMSTPFGERGFFYETWEDKENQFERYSITAKQCPRITPEFLADEKRSLNSLVYLQEYFCKFAGVMSQAFSKEEIAEAFNTDSKPLDLDSDDNLASQLFDILNRPQAIGVPA